MFMLQGFKNLVSGREHYHRERWGMATRACFEQHRSRKSEFLHDRSCQNKIPRSWTHSQKLPLSDISKNKWVWTTGSCWFLFRCNCIGRIWWGLFQWTTRRKVLFCNISPEIMLLGSNVHGEGSHAHCISSRIGTEKIGSPLRTSEHRRPYSLNSKVPQPRSSWGRISIFSCSLCFSVHIIFLDSSIISLFYIEHIQVVGCCIAFVCVCVCVRFSFFTRFSFKLDQIQEFQSTNWNL